MSKRQAAIRRRKPHAQNRLTRTTPLPKSCAFFLVSLPALLGFAALIEGLLWLTGSTSETSSFVALILVAYLFHRHFLFGEALSLTGRPVGAAWSLSRLGTFGLVSVGVGFLPLVLGVFLTFAIVENRPSPCFCW